VNFYDLLPKSMQHFLERKGEENLI